MGLKKHKRHKSEKREKGDGNSADGCSEKPPALKLILKVGGNVSTPEHSNDSMGPTSTSYGTPQGSLQSMPLTEEESVSMASITSGSHTERHKKMKKKKKKKEKDKSKEKHEKKHKHRHKEKRKRPHEDVPQEEERSGVAEMTIVEPPKKAMLELPVPTPIIVKPNPEHVPLPKSPSRAPMSPRSEAREQRACVMRQKMEHSPFNKLLDYLLKLLEKRDPQQFFAWPVTDSFAPGYSNIITQPMDFSTIKQKIDDHVYNKLSDFVDDFKLMCSNAMTYNHSETIYYKAARRLLHHGTRLLAPDKIKPLRSVLPFMYDVTVDQMGFEFGPEEEEGETEVLDEPEVIQEIEPPALPVVEKPKPRLPREMPKSKFEAISDDLNAEEVLTQVTGAAKEAARKLAKRRTNGGNMGFLRQKKDGTTTLNIIVPNDGVAPGTNERPVLLGTLIGKLQHGTGQLQGFKEDRRNFAKAVKPLYYGSFGSYAPTYDSTFASLTKEESDLVYQTYGDETSVQYAESILDFAKDCDYALTMVDNLLDLMTGGDHRRTKRVIEDRRRLREEEERIRQLMEPVPEPVAPPPDIDFQNLRTLGDLGIDTAFLTDLEKDTQKKEEQGTMQARLDETSQLIEKLQKAQHDRLSQPPPQHLSHIPGPSEVELDLAERVADGLTDISKRLPPEAITPVASVRKALGVAAIVQEPPVADLESELREFLESQSALAVDHSPLHDDKTIEEILSES